MSHFILAFLLAFATLSPLEKTIDGTVVDAKGKPVDAAEVFFSCGKRVDGAIPIVARTKTDEQGRFHLSRPSKEQLRPLQAPYGTIWAYRSGKAIGAKDWWTNMELADPLVKLVLDDAAPRSITLTAGDGKPLSGAKVTPRILLRTNMTVKVPDELADRLAGTTDLDGRAILSDLSATIQLLEIRVAHSTLADQNLTIEYATASKQSSIALQLKPLGRLVGKLSVDKTDAARTAIEVWKKLEGMIDTTLAPVRFEQGLISVAADGSFETPVVLEQGASYRVVVRAPGFAPTISRWIVLDDATADFGAIAVPKVKEIAGRVVDRQGKPLADVRVFQSGDGPEPTSTTTDDKGRFHLGGFSREHAFVFATKDGFRFQGRDVDLSKREDASITLTRTTEPAERSLTTLPDNWTREEMRTAARRLLEPVMEKMLKEANDSDKYWLFRTLVNLDPVDAIERLERTKFEHETSPDMIRGLAAVALASSDPDEAAATAESTRNAGFRGNYLLTIASKLPTKDRARKIALIERAVVIERAVEDVGGKLPALCRAVEMLHSLGERDKARSLMNELVTLAEKLPDKNNYGRAWVASSLSHFDVDKALQITESLDPGRIRDSVMEDIVANVAATDAKRSLEIARSIKDSGSRYVSVARACRVLNRADSKLAKSFIDLIDGPAEKLDAWLFLGESLVSIDKAAAVAAYRSAESEMTKLSDDSINSIINQAAITLPLVEAIDPSLVEETLWRSLSLRLSTFDPRKLSGTDDDSFTLPMAVARYDRRVAGIVFEPTLARNRESIVKNKERNVYSDAFVALAIDPKTAIELVEAIPLAKTASYSEPSNFARIELANLLALDNSARWRLIWRRNTGIGHIMYENP